MGRKVWLLVILSVGLNVAFVTTWIVHAVSRRHDGMKHCRHREGEECRRRGCGGTIVRCVQQQRSTFYCPECQN